MTSLTDRYVHAVTTQLPDDQREDIARELRAAIDDAVAADADPDAAQAERRALQELGHPASLADSYRGEPRALIGPRLYPAWLRTLKALLTWVPLLAAGVVLVIAALDGDSPVEILGAGVSALLWSALQVAFWVTLGFAIAERTGMGRDELDALGADDPAEWDPADLPEPEDRLVSWGEAITGVVTTAFVLVLLLLPGRLGGEVEGVAWGQIFTDSAYSLRWVLAAGMAVSLLVSIVVLARRRWTWPTALVNLAGGLAFTAPVVWLAVRNDLIAWDTLPLSWIRSDGEALQINEQLTLGATVAVLVAVFLWETVDSFRRARRG